MLPPYLQLSFPVRGAIFASAKEGSSESTKADSEHY